MRRASMAAIGVVGLCLGASPSGAATITLDFFLKGNLDSFGQNNAVQPGAAGNTLVGINAGGLNHNGYWVFDLSGIADSILSATLTVGNPFSGYSSADPTETLGIFDYSGSIATLQNQSATSVAAFADLGSGAVYGTRDVSSADRPTCPCTSATSFPVEIALGGAGFLTDINGARGGLFALGGHLTTAAGSARQLMFGFTSNLNPARLTLETGPAADAPEPSSLALAMAGLAGLGLVRRARRRTGRSAAR